VIDPDADFCHLTTRGRVSGRPHEIEIWFALDGSTVYLLSGGGTRSDWVRNLSSDAAVTVRFGDVTYEGSARVVAAGDEREERARTLVFEKYQPRYGGDLRGWRTSALPVAIELHGG
jgi:deazaflavin-dependent oxidoreductase (nitroreductase family)